MRIERASLEDVPQIGPLIADCVRAMQASGNDQWDAVYPTAEIAAADARAGTLWVARHQGRCVAAMALDSQQSPEYQTVVWRSAPENLMVIHRLMVSPEFQGQGLGRRMLRFAERHAYEAGFASIRLDVYTGNPRARRLYVSHGYQLVGEVRFPRRRLPFECFEKILPGAFQAGGVELLPAIQPLWEALRAHHAAMAPAFAAEVLAKTFASRAAEFRDKSTNGKLRVDLFRRQPEGELAGYAVTSFCAADQSSELDSLYVDPALRGQGIGTLLVRRAMAWLHGCGARKPVVSVLSQNEAALRFYRPLGFHPRSVNLMPQETSVWEEESQPWPPD